MPWVRTPEAPRVPRHTRDPRFRLSLTGYVHATIPKSAKIGIGPIAYDISAFVSGPAASMGAFASCVTPDLPSRPEGWPSFSKVAFAPRTLPRISSLLQGLPATVSSSLPFPGSTSGYRTVPCSGHGCRFLGRDEPTASPACLACPCHRAIPTTPPKGDASSVSLRRPLLPSPGIRGNSAFGRLFLFGAILWVHFR